MTFALFEVWLSLIEERKQKLRLNFETSNKLLKL